MQLHTSVKGSDACERKVFGTASSLHPPRKLHANVHFPAKHLARAWRRPGRPISAHQEGEGAEDMDSLIRLHAERIYGLVEVKLKRGGKYLVAVAGSPGSGKTTTTNLLCKQLNAMHKKRSKGSFAVSVSMDGFHYYRRELDGMEDPEEAHAKRGAHWTFNAAAFVEAVKSLRQKGEMLFPSFDHAYGDPIEDDVQVLPEHRVVILEGNYVLLDEEPWRQLKDIVDESLFIDCNIDVAMQRVIERQVGNGSDLRTAKGRVNGNDRPNAELIHVDKDRADYILPSLPFKMLRPEE